MRHEKVMLLSQFFAAASFAVTLSACSLSDKDRSGLFLGPADSGRVITGQSFSIFMRDYGILAENVTNLTIEFCKVDGGDSAGILLRGCVNTVVRYCTIENQKKSGIRISQEAESRGVQIVECTFREIQQDAVLAAVDDDKFIRHTGLVILSNTVSRSGLDTSRPGLYHGFNIQTPGYRIEKNLIQDVANGSGLSLGAGGVVRDNLVVRVGKHGIAYYPDHDSLEAAVWSVESNRVWDWGRNSAFSGAMAYAALEAPAGVAWIPVKYAVVSYNGAGMSASSLSSVDVGWPTSPDYLTDGKAAQFNYVLTNAPLECRP